MFRNLLLLIAFSSAFASFAFPSVANVYITQNGNSQGVCTASLHDPTWFNNAGNWGTAANQIGPGTVVHLCGTFTAAAGQQLFVTQGNGSVANPITILADQGAVSLSSPAFSSNGAVVIKGSYITFNGEGNLTIQNTANGTGLAYNQQSQAVNITGSNDAFEGVTIKNICQRSAGDVGDSCSTGGNDSGGIVINGPGSNVTVTLNTISNGGHTCIWYSGNSSDTGIAISNNTVSGCNWGIGGSGATSGLTVSGNDVTCVAGALCNWDDTADSNHHNGIFFFPPDGSNMNNVVFSNNYVHDINGNATAYLFLATSGSTGNLPGVLIYNNVFFTTSGQSGPANGMITIGPSIISPRIFNNTFSGPGARGWSADSSSIAQNNIAVGQGYVSYFDSGANGSNLWSHNDYYNWGNGWDNGGVIYSSFAAWQAGTSNRCSGGCDIAGSIIGDPVLNADFTLGAGSVAKGKGANLASFGIAGLNQGAPQFFGVNYACGNGCVARTSSGAWDIGAYPVSGASSAPAAPSGLAALVQ